VSSWSGASFQNRSYWDSSALFWKPESTKDDSLPSGFSSKARCLRLSRTERYSLSRFCFEMTRQATKTRCGKLSFWVYDRTSHVYFSWRQAVFPSSWTVYLGIINLWDGCGGIRETFHPNILPSVFELKTSCLPEQLNCLSRYYQSIGWLWRPKWNFSSQDTATCLRAEDKLSSRAAELSI
jgi:hypothetical protein